MLSPDLQVMFRRTGVFAGGCDLEAFSAVAMADSDVSTDGDPLHWVGELLDVCLVTIAEGRDGEPRVRLLETLRQYALERLAQEDDLEAARRRHAEYYAGFAEQARDRLDGRMHWAWLDRLEIEHDNLQDALSWALTQRAADNDNDSQVSTGLRLVQALAPFWYQHGHAKKAQQWLERAVEIASDAAGAPLARIAHWLG